ncbi:MAG: GDP-mannose 4,6-dehydratase [Gemmatimonadaceae bacterium]|nr:GDP-mannose 4,6-dehydratase [Gemmatimonadaceae bacterium]
MSRILITGGAGFIGSHLADRYLALGHEVTVIDNLASGKREQVPAGATFVETDVRSEEAARLVREGSYDIVAHLAGQMDVRVSVRDPQYDAAVNISGTLNLLEAVRALDPARRPRFMFSSTGGVLYGDFVTPPNAEHVAKDPDSPYAISKLTAETYMAYYGRVHGMECVALRFGNVYGPRQDPHGEAGVIAIFCGRLQANEPFRIFGDGSQTRDYIYVSDVVDAFVVASSAALPPVGRLDARAFNVGTGVERTVVDVARGLQRAAGREVPIEFAPARPGEPLKSGLDPAKAAEVLGWRATTALDEGLAATWRWITGA